MAALHVVVVRPYACGEMRHGGWRRSRQIDELLASAGMAADVCTTDRASGFDPRGMRDIARAGPRAWTWSHLIDATARSHGLRVAREGGPPHDGGEVVVFGTAQARHERRMLAWLVG